MFTRATIAEIEAAKAALARHLATTYNRTDVTLRLLHTGTRLADGHSGPERDFYYFEAGENDGWYVNADDLSVEHDENCPQSA